MARWVASLNINFTYQKYLNLRTAHEFEEEIGQNWGTDFKRQASNKENKSLARFATNFCEIDLFPSNSPRKSLIQSAHSIKVYRGWNQRRNGEDTFT